MAVRIYQAKTNGRLLWPYRRTNKWLKRLKEYLSKEEFDRQFFNIVKKPEID